MWTPLQLPAQHQTNIWMPPKPPGQHQSFIWDPPAQHQSFIWTPPQPPAQQLTPPWAPRPPPLFQLIITVHHGPTSPHHPMNRVHRGPTAGREVRKYVWVPVECADKVIGESGYVRKASGARVSVGEVSGAVMSWQLRCLGVVFRFGSPSSSYSYTGKFHQSKAQSIKWFGQLTSLCDHFNYDFTDKLNFLLSRL